MVQLIQAGYRLSESSFAPRISLFVFIDNCLSIGMASSLPLVSLPYCLSAFINSSWIPIQAAALALALYPLSLFRRFPVLIHACLNVYPLTLSLHVVDHRRVEPVTVIVNPPDEV